jgi:uncharacterized surface protein with fasciclin (FAS1) repeats
MTKFASILLLAAAGAAAQEVNTTVLGEIAKAFTDLGFTELATAAASITNTTAGKQLLATITNGNNNYTIFAPTNEALGAANQTALGDPETLATIVSYHVVPGEYKNETEFFKAPNNTILPTFLNSTDFVNLQGNASQVLSVTYRDGDIDINNQPNGTIRVDKIYPSGRFTIYGIDRVLTPPGSLAQAARRANLTQFSQLLESANLTDIVTNAKGITIFAPTDAAITAAVAQLGSQATNATLIQTILQNHVINGTTIYSTQFDDANFTSAAGQDINFFVSNNTIRIYSGEANNITANVTTRDLLASNGVIHIIDAVLANTQRDDGAASSAYNSATSSANDAKPTGGNGGPTGPVGGGPNDNNGGGDAAVSLMMKGWSAVAGAAAVAAVLASL